MLPTMQFKNGQFITSFGGPATPTPVGQVMSVFSPALLQVGDLTGEYGSILRALINSPVNNLVQGNIFFDERPEQMRQYPTVVVEGNRKSTEAEYTFVDDQGNVWKTIHYPVPISIYGVGVTQTRTVAAAVEAVMDSEALIYEIALDFNLQTQVYNQYGNQDCIASYDKGRSMGREGRQFDQFGRRTYVCHWDWEIYLKYPYNLNQVPNQGEDYVIPTTGGKD